VSHPSLGLPPPDPTAGFAAAAARVSANRERLAGRALRSAIDRDPTIESRHDEAGLRQLLRDAELLVDRVVMCLRVGEPDLVRDYAEWTAPVYRIGLCEGLRSAFPSVLAPGEIATAGIALDEAIRVYRWHRRLAGDARKRNPLLQLLYKGG
jgi:hypothetical protein